MYAHFTITSIYISFNKPALFRTHSLSLFFHFSIYKLYIIASMNARPSAQFPIFFSTLSPCRLYGSMIMKHT